MTYLLSNDYIEQYIAGIKPVISKTVPEQPRISIVTSFYNGNELIIDTAQCILGQTFQDFEWLVINDGSMNEKSLAVLEEFSKIDSRIKILHHEKNKGLPAGRNTGVKAAKGRYIFFIDSDDLLDQTALEKFYLFLQVNKDIAFVNSYVVGFGNQNYLWSKGFEQKENFLNENFNTSTFLARKEVFEALQFDESITGGYEDWDFWLHAASKGFWGYTIPEYLFWYRRNDHAAKWENWQSHDKRESFIAYLNKKYQHPFSSISRYHPDLNKTYGTFPVVDNVIEPYEVSKSDRKKLVFLFPWLNLGGADKFNLDLIEGLVNYEWDISIITTLKSSHPWQAEFSRYTNRIFHLSNLGGYHQYLDYLELYIQANQPDILVISNSMHSYFSLPFLRAKFPAIPVVDYIHCDDPDWLNGGYPRLNTVFSHLLDKTIVSSNQLKGWIEERRVPNKRNTPIEVCYTNISTQKIYRDYDNRKKIRSSWNIDEEFTVILYAARLTDQKQPFVLLNTIDRLNKVKENFVCIVCGDGPHFEAVKKMTEEKGLANKIWMMGALKQQEVLSLMDAADIFFLPSKYEGIALSIYEAMAKELVVVGANVGGQAELVTKDCGFLIEPSEPEREAEEYFEILSTQLSSPEKRVAYTKKALIKLKERFDIEVMYKRMHQLLLEVVTEKKAGQESAISANDFAFMYNAYWNKELIANEIWGEYIYTKSQSKVLSSQLPIPYESQEEWFKSEHTKLKEWYHEQYEVLPAWYKRIGHIIKVFKGKRTFSSLLK